MAHNVLIGSKVIKIHFKQDVFNQIMPEFASQIEECSCLKCMDAQTLNSVMTWGV